MLDDNEIQNDMFYCLQYDDPAVATSLYYATAFVAICATICLFF